MERFSQKKKNYKKHREETLRKILLVTADIFVHVDTRHLCGGTVLGVKA